MEYKILIIIFLISVSLNYLFIKVNFFKDNQLNKQAQDIHVGKIPRLGGLIIIILFFGYQILFLNGSNILFWCSIIVLTPAFLEDLRFSITPLIRLTTIIISCFILITNLSALPQFNFGPINILFNNHIFQIIFFTLAMATIINGQNIIDGTNGLSAVTALSIFGSILYLGIYLNDLNVIKTSLVIIILIVGFLFFNYPHGKIFLGDTGSYFLGLISSYLIIDIFARNQDLSSWSAVVIFIYPLIEVSTSYFRRILSKKSPFSPDNMHLHSKMYNLISIKIQDKRLSNALVTPFLFIIWLVPQLLMPLTLHNHYIALLIILILFTLYLILYYLLSKYQT